MTDVIGRRVLFLTWALAVSVALAGTATGWHAQSALFSGGPIRHGGPLPAGAWAAIASHNLLIGVRLLLGAASLGLYSAAELFMTGVILGAVSKSAYASGFPFAELLRGILPHGVFELTGFSVLASFGFQAAWLAWRALCGADVLPWRALGRFVLRQSLIGFAFIAAASVVEVFVTPYVVAW